MLVLIKAKPKLNFHPKPIGVRISSALLFITGTLLVSAGGVKSVTCIKGASTGIANSSSTCVVEASRVLVPTERKIDLEDLKRAALREQLNNDHTAYKHKAYQVVLLTRQGEIPLTSASRADKEEKNTIASEINQFLDNSRQRNLRVNLENYLWRDAVGLFLFTVGVMAQLFAEQLAQSFSRTRPVMEPRTRQ